MGSPRHKPRPPNLAPPSPTCDTTPQDNPGPNVTFSDITVLVVGDVMLDRFIYTNMERISPEAPVPVLRLTRTTEVLGGAANVVANVASLGGRAVLVGLVGRDAPGERLRHLLADRPGIHAAIIPTIDRPTICKTRYIASQQQVVRIDEESEAPLTQPERDALMAAIATHLSQAGAVVLSDYGKGVLDEASTAAIIRMARERGLPVFVDPKSPDFSRYRGATCITPNLKELALAAGMPVDTEPRIIEAARHVMARAEAAAILATRSADGMMLIEGPTSTHDGAVHTVAARAREVFDVSGAGDTVIATMALCHAAGRSLVAAMHVANAAASVVVSKRGTATATMAEVMSELEARDAAHPDTPPTTALPLHRVAAQVERWKAQGLVVGFTNGCFDIIHPGHIALLEQARAACDRLVVALNTDASTSRLKGPTRPINPLESRARVMAAIRTVDCVTAFDEDTPYETIRALAPDVLIKGADYAIDQVVGADLVQKAGGRVVLAHLTPGQSTTAIVAASQATSQNGPTP